MRFKPFALALPVITLASLNIARAQDYSHAINGPGSTLSQAARPAVLHSPKLPVGLQLMARFDLLPTLRDTKCVQDSSYDRSGGNDDWGRFYKVEGNKATLADIKGPGCIYRFWSANADGHLKIYFDGEATPRIDCPMQDFFLGKVAPFVAPLVGHRSGGWYCFFPMPFQKSCRIEVENPGNMYYQAQYQLYPDNTRIQTYTNTLSRDDQKALDTILAQWKNMGSDPKPPQSASKTLEGNATLAAGKTLPLASIKGAGQIAQIHMKITPADRFSLRQTLLRVYWDGDTKPAIEAPVGEFFGSGFGDQHFTALPDAMTEADYVCYWPMPFGKSARFELVNTGQSDLSNITYRIVYTPTRRMMTDAGYFHAQWHRETTQTGKPFPILQTSGRGLYVGEHTDMQGDRGIGFLEGDEKFYVDSETFPSIHGTGTEDFYTGGWYFDQGPFNLAYHGCITKDEGISRVGAYRYQIQDCVPFQNKIDVSIEHGGTNDYPGADYSCVAYWYQDAPHHDWSPIDPAQLTPAVTRIAGAMEAETLQSTQGKTDLVDERQLRSELSGGKAVSLDAGLHTFQFNVPTEDVYTVSLYQPEAPGSVKLDTGWWVDNLAPGDPASGNQGMLDKGEKNSTHTTMRLTPGVHSFSLNIPAGKTAYLDYMMLYPSRKEKNVTEAESFLKQVGVQGGGTVTREDVAANWSGSSALVWKPMNPGDSLSLPINLAAEGDFALDLGISTQPNGPMLDVQMDDATLGTIDTFAPKLELGRAAMRFPLGRANSLKAGPHTLKLVYKSANPAVKQPEIWFDYFALRHAPYANSLEAESLKVLEAKDGDATTQEMSGFGDGWSGSNQFWFQAHKVGALSTLEFPVAAAGKYKLVVYYTTARDYGTVQVSVDGTPIGAATNLYSQNVVPKGRTELGTLDLTAGNHRMTFLLTGKDDRSTGFLVGVDAIGLEPVK